VASPTSLFAAGGIPVGTLPLAHAEVATHDWERNAQARSEKRRDDPQPAGSRNVRPLVSMICVALVTAFVVLGITWMNRLPTFGVERPPHAQTARLHAS
jgi:hypothetical protein